MFIDIDKIGSKGLDLDDKVAMDEDLLIEEESYFLDEVTYRVRLSREGSKVRAKGSLRTLVSLPCVGCLEPFDLKIDSRFDIILFPMEMVELTNATLSADDMEYIFFEGERIDLVKILMEQVNLFIPYKPVCNPECKGLCPTCGANLNYESCQCETSAKELSFLFNKIKR